MSLRFISVRGATEHNLKNIDLDIPKDKLIVITGVSGSGKSSLAFDTIYAEGQRRYVESLSAYARQFLELMPKPNVDSIEGLSPAISIEQKTTSKNPRSTVGTVTELYDYLRLLFARIGVAHSPTTGLPIRAQTIPQMVEQILAFDEGTKWYVMAPVASAKKGEFKKEFAQYQKQGYERFFVDGHIYEYDELPSLQKNIKHDISVVVDRIVIKKDHDEFRTRLNASIETVLSLSGGLVHLKPFDTNDITTFSSLFSCPVSGFSIGKIEPRLFSFNSPQGACGTCSGLGVEMHFSKERIIDPKKTVLKGGLVPWFRDSASPHARDYYVNLIKSILSHYNEDDIYFDELKPETQNTFLYGTQIPVSGGTSIKLFEGLIPYLKRKSMETDASENVREFLATFQEERTCASCEGKRLNQQALCVKIHGVDIGIICDFSIEECLHWFNALTLTAQDFAIAERILREITSRLQFLMDVGLHYLTLSRTAGTLSGGESQRIRLASQVGSRLSGVLYVLDEPSIGLHQRDNDRLLTTLKNLRDLGNTVIVVEHDEDAIRIADHVVEMGPYAGTHGGHVMSQGTIEHLLSDQKSLTGAYLSGKETMPDSLLRPGNGKVLSLKGASLNNLKNVDIEIPLGTLTCVSGVSGGGKSSLIIETLYKILSATYHGTLDVPGPYTSLQGMDYLDKVINVDQSPIGRTPRSNPATYIGCFTLIREWFSKLPEAKARGYAAGRFSFNVKGGRCESCCGDGVIKISMHFLPDVYVRCEACQGKRYNQETLDILYRGYSIADVLDLTVDEAAIVFKDHPGIYQKLHTLQQVGLGYIHVGQQATTLSGGEAQRIKLSKELSKRASGKTIYILDEPTTGLHFHDIKKLLDVLGRLVDQGNTVVVIEHNLDVIKSADWVIDIGPDGGKGGGRIVATGTPYDLCQNSSSHTGYYLRKVMNNVKK